MISVFQNWVHAIQVDPGRVVSCHLELWKSQTFLFAFRANRYGAPFRWLNTKIIREYSLSPKRILSTDVIIMLKINYLLSTQWNKKNKIRGYEIHCDSCNTSKEHDMYYHL